jgi:hypothetical protein
MWMDGENVLPKMSAATMYPGMRNWWVVGLYRDEHIGDPNLRYKGGAPVYGTDGSPTVIYLDGFAVGKTWESLMSAGTLIPPHGNLIVNGDFSLGLTGWEQWDVQRISVSGAEGRVSGGGGTARFAQSTTILPNHQYRLSFRMRTENATGFFGALVKDLFSGVSRFDGGAVPYAPSQGYVNYFYNFNSGESGGVYVYIGNWRGSTGNAYIRDVSLVDTDQDSERSGLAQPGFVSALSFGLGRILRMTCLYSQCENRP